MKTTEKQLSEIGVAILLFLAVGVCAKSCISCKNELSKRPTTQELHQLQEMKDYHRSEGREIIIF